MASYLADIRASAARPGQRVMAPGDREWAEATRRTAGGIPMSPGLAGEYRQIAERFGLDDVELRKRKMS